MRRAAAAILVVLFACASSAQGQDALDSLGGWAELRSDASGWFRVTRLDNRWWLIDPEGHAFLSLGVNGIALSPASALEPNQYRESAMRKHGNRREWAFAALRRLRAWGFNTVGSGSDRMTWRQGLPYTMELDLSGHLRAKGDQSFPDVFAPSFEREAGLVARRLCRSRATDPTLLGYFTDADLPWCETSEDNIAQFLRLGDYAPGRIAVLRFLEERYQQIEELNKAWDSDYQSFQEIGRVPQVGAVIPLRDRDDFLRLVAERYFTVAQEVVRASDPNHLLLGCRFEKVPPTPVLQAMTGRVDVISLNCREQGAPSVALRRVYHVTLSPILITEFTVPAVESGSDDAEARAPAVSAQQARGQSYEQCLMEVLSLPMVIGCHWHAYADSPSAEEGNGGLVSLEDEPHQGFVALVTAANEGAYRRHAGGNSAHRPTAAE